VNVRGVTTRVFRPPRDDLWDLLASSLPPLTEESIVAVASKVVSIGEGRCVPAEGRDKDALIVREADRYLDREEVPGAYVLHTLTHGLLAPSAGIDASNAAGHYILWPRDPARSARRIWRFLRARHGLKRLGVVVTDSRSVPLRRGVVGFALAHCGFRPLRDYRGRRDLFGRHLRFSQTNVADALAAAAVLVMGEGAEQTPLAVITEVPEVRFAARPIPSRRPYASLVVPPEEDLFWPFLRGVPWRTGGGGGSGRPDA
jgi:coenzyme F420-0:L-glutamate ligase